MLPGEVEWSASSRPGEVPCRSLRFELRLGNLAGSSWFVLLETNEQQPPLRVECELHIQFPTVDDRLIDILPNCGIAGGRHGLLEVLCGKAGDNVEYLWFVHAQFFWP